MWLLWVPGLCVFAQTTLQGTGGLRGSLAGCWTLEQFFQPCCSGGGSGVGTWGPDTALKTWGWCLGPGWGSEGTEAESLWCELQSQDWGGARSSVVLQADLTWSVGSGPSRQEAIGAWRVESGPSKWQAVLQAQVAGGCQVRWADVVSWGPGTVDFSAPT